MCGLAAIFHCPEVTMKKFAIVVVILLVTGYLGWQNRVDILVWGAPKLTLLMNPVLANVPTQWTQGPAIAALPANERQPNIILILVRSEERFSRNAETVQ